MFLGAGEKRVEMFGWRGFGRGREAEYETAVSEDESGDVVAGVGPWGEWGEGGEGGAGAGEREFVLFMSIKNLCPPNTDDVSGILIIPCNCAPFALLVTPPTNTGSTLMLRTGYPVANSNMLA